MYIDELKILLKNKKELKTQRKGQNLQPEHKNRIWH